MLEEIDEWDIEVAHKNCGLPGVYIGRPSPWGNPFHVSAGVTREDVIARYETWLRNQLRESWQTRKLFDMLCKHVEDHKPLRLLCYCAPKPCHGDVIKKLIEERLSCTSNSS